MQQLHLVGVTTDHDSLIFSIRKGAKSGSFVLPLEEGLVAAVAEAVRRMNAAGSDLELPIDLDAAAAPQRRQSQLSPREIQDRLRGGRTLEEVATEAGVGEEWVARFAAPVEAERNQIVSRSRGLVYAKSRLGNSREPLGLSVRWNLADRGVRMTDDDFDSAWSGYLLHTSTWMVTFSFVSRKREQKAEWEVDLETATLTSRNRLASDLGYVEPGRRRRSLTSLQPPASAPVERPAPGATRAAAKSTGSGSPAAAGGEVPAKAGSSATRKAAARARPKKAATAQKAAARKATKATRAGKATKATAKKAISAKKTTSTKKAAATKKAAPKTAPATKASIKKAARKAGATKKASIKKAPATKKARAKKAPATKKAPAAKKATAARSGAGGKVAAATRKAPTRKKATKREKSGAATAPSRTPPAGGSDATSPPAAERPASRPAPNELGLRRLQMIGGTNGGTQEPRPGSQPGGGYAARAASTTPAPRRHDEASASSWSPSAASPRSAPSAPSEQSAPSVRSARPAQPQAPPTRSAPRDPEPAGRIPGADPAFGGDLDSGLDVTPAEATASPGNDNGNGSGNADAASLAESRRLERRRARAARQPDAGPAGPAPADITAPDDDEDDWQAFAAAAPGGRGARRPAGRPGAGEGTGDDGRVVTIRANRATPPTSEGEVILPPDLPPLRPAQPPAQPKKRRFGRNGR